MTFDTKKPIDEISWQILRLLQDDARLSYREIGKQVGLTAPAVAERVRRLEETGILTGYHAAVNTVKLGLPINAIVHLVTTNQQSMRFQKEAHKISEILECFCVTGNESYILKVAVMSVPHLENLLHRLKPYGQMRTSLILSTTIEQRPVNEDVFSQWE